MIDGCGVRVAVNIFDAAVVDRREIGTTTGVDVQNISRPDRSGGALYVVMQVPSRPRFREFARIMGLSKMETARAGKIWQD